MFNKKESSAKRKIELKIKNKLVKVGVFLVATNFLLNNSVSAENNQYEEYLQNHFRYESDVFNYYQRLENLTREKDYDKSIAELYHNGSMLINGQTYSLGSFLLRYSKDAENHNLHLISSYDDCQDILTRSYEEYKYDGIVKFKDTTAFINYILDTNTEIDREHNIIIVDNDRLLFYINNWDGMRHDRVAETDAILEHRVLDRR